MLLYIWNIQIVSLLRKVQMSVIYFLRLHEFRWVWFGVATNLCSKFVSWAMHKIFLNYWSNWSSHSALYPSTGIPCSSPKSISARGVTWFHRVCPFKVVFEIGRSTHELFRNSLEIVQFGIDFFWTVIFTNLALRFYYYSRFQCVQDIRNVWWKTSQNQVVAEITVASWRIIR